jgi:hypothetical protein
MREEIDEMLAIKRRRAQPQEPAPYSAVGAAVQSSSGSRSPASPGQEGEAEEKCANCGYNSAQSDLCVASL